VTSKGTSTKAFRPGDEKMVGGLFIAGLASDSVGSSLARDSAQQAKSSAMQNSTQLKQLEHHVERLSLLNQALWELLRGRLGMTDADLEKIAEEIDMRDGRADGKMTATPVKCPTCSRTCNSKHHQCLYCGQLFEKPLFG
jgi:hypothetical protein